MTPELINQSVLLFDTFDKWNAFIELSNGRGEIRKRYFEKLKSQLLNHFSKDVNQYWRFSIINNEQYRCFLSDYGQESICLFWCVDDLKLWCNPQLFDAALARELLNTPEFNPILNCFDYIDTLSSPNLHHFCEEKHRFIFEDSTSYIATNESNHDKLSWFAGNKTEEMTVHIAAQINKFRTPEITELLIELNNRCKKQTK